MERIAKEQMERGGFIAVAYLHGILFNGGDAFEKEMPVHLRAEPLDRTGGGEVEFVPSLAVFKKLSMSRSGW